MSGEASAHERYRHGTPGFYVVNPETNIAVAGPDTEFYAKAEAQERNRTPPLSPIQLVAVEIRAES